MKVTLHEVAARSGVSIATVSRALNGLAVSKANRVRVEAAARELGYVPNEAARALRSERTMTMGLIFSDLRNTLGIDLLDALSEAIEEAGFSLLISTARGEPHRYDVLMRRFLERRVDALFCVRPRGPGAALGPYALAGIPVANLFSGADAFTGLPTLFPVFGQAARELGAHLRSLGHVRIAIVRREPRAAPLQAIGEGLKAQGLLVEAVEASEADGMRGCLAALMARAHRPTVVVATDPHSRGLIAAGEAAGVAIPQTLSVVSLSEIAAEGYHRRRAISSVTIDPARMGRAAAAAMLAWLAGEHPQDRLAVEAAAFTARGTTGPSAL